MNDSGLTRLFHHVVRHPVAMSMICIAALVFGMVSYQRLAIELMPDLSYPTITVRTPFEGAAPEEVESQISRMLEARLATLNGLVSLESRSRANQSDVVLSFAWGSHMGDAAQSVRETLQTVFLPDNVERPMILRYDPSLEPFLRVALAVDDDVAGKKEEALYLLRDVAEREIKRELEAMSGVAAVQVRGGLEREIHVRLREDWMAARKLSLGDVQNALSSENVNMAGGSIIEGNKEYLIRTLNEFESAESIAELRIRRSDGVLIPLTDVAEVKRGFRDRDVISFLDGKAAVELEIFKEADANVVSIAGEVKRRLLGDGTPKAARKMLGQEDPIVDSLPEAFSMALLDDQAAFIESSVRNLRNTVLLGGLLAVFVLFLFLRNLRSTIIIGLAIPISVVLAFGPLYLSGVSLNLMSLGGLALGVGMLVDNGVVVLESIQRYLDKKESQIDAAVHGTRDVAAAVTASTLTTVAVFFPMTFVEGVAGELFGDLAIAVVASLVASLLVALFLVPTMAAVQFSTSGMEGHPVLSRLTTAWRGGGKEAWVALFQAAVVAPARDGVTAFKEWWNRPKRPWSWLGLPYVLFREVFVAMLGLGVGLFLCFVASSSRLFVLFLGVVLWPVGAVFRMLAAGFYGVYEPLERVYSRSLPRVLRRPGLVLGLAVLVTLVSLVFGRSLGTELIPELHQGRFTVEAALPVGTPIETTVDEVKRMDEILAAHPEIENAYTTVGADRRADTASDEGEHTARIRVQLKPGGDLAKRETKVMDDLRTQLGRITRMELNLVRPAMFSFKTPVEVVIYGYDLVDLQQAGDDVVAAMADLPGLRDVRSSQGRGYPELRILYDRTRLNRYGLDTFGVATKVRNRIQGVEATRLQWGDRKLDVKLQLSESQRQTVEDLGRLNINPNLIPPIPLDAVATLKEGYGPSEIRRVDQQRAVVISANTVGFDLGSASQEINERLGALRLPDGMQLEMAGQAKEMKSSMQSLWFALLLAIFLVYVIMASSFESILHPFVILFSVPLALVGVAMSLWIFGLAISAVVAIGAIVLAGVVVNNAIVLVDTINRLKEEGLDRDSAIAEASRLRLRPIMMTTMTTVLGLMPLAIGPLFLGWVPDSWGLAEGVEIQQPLAITVIGGLLSSTLLTLVIVPVLYRTMTRKTAS